MRDVHVYVMSINAHIRLGMCSSLFSTSGLRQINQSNIVLSITFIDGCDVYMTLKTIVHI